MIVYTYLRIRTTQIPLSMSRVGNCALWLLNRTVKISSLQCLQPVKTLQAFAPFVMLTHRSWQIIWAAIMVIKTWKRGVVEISILRIPHRGRFTWRKLYFLRLATSYAISIVML